MKPKRLAGILGAVVLGQLSGCAAGVVGAAAVLSQARYTQVAVSAYAQPGPVVGKRFVLKGPDPRYPGGDPAWPGYARLLTSALEAKGYTPVDSSPDLVVRATYGVGDTQTWVTETPSGNSGTSSASQTSIRRAALHVEALDAKSYAAGNPTVVWSTHADASILLEDNIGPVFPQLVAAAQEYFDTSEPTRVSLWVSRNGDDGKLKVFHASDLEASKGASEQN